MPKALIQLKQHTPILQFQPENGAGIRGSELKPQLDKYLRKYCSAQLEKEKAWFLPVPEGSSHKPALDYRVKIVDQTTQLIDQEMNGLKKTGFFTAGSMEEGGVKHYPMISTATTLTILSAHRGLIDLIKEQAPSFFASTNFGYRKSKGFGSYTVTQIDAEVLGDQSIRNAIAALGNHGKKIYKITDGNIGNSSNSIDILQRVATVSTIMKSGRNFGSTYDRSILMKEYGYSKGYSNEKRMIKLKLAGLNNNYDATASDGTAQKTRVSPYQGEYRYARALLGFTDSYRFRQGPIVHVFDAKHIDDDSQFRLESPLLFKPVRENNKWTVYIIQRDIPAEAFGRSFYLSLSDKKNEVKKNLNTPSPRSTVSIKTPSEGEFNLQEFLDYVAGYGLPSHPAKKAIDESGKTVGLYARYPLIEEVK